MTCLRENIVTCVTSANDSVSSDTLVCINVFSFNIYIIE